VFDDEDGDVVLAVMVMHQCVGQHIGELIRGDMFGEQ